MISDESTADWSASVASAWGKTRPDDGAWLPLVVHLEDALAVAELLWDRWLSPITKNRIVLAVGGDETAARSLFVWATAVHDVAKLAPAFAGKARDVGMAWLLDDMVRAGLCCPVVPRDEYAHHGVMGQVVVQNWLEAKHGLTNEAAESVAVLIGGHHGIPPASSDLQRTMGKFRARHSDGWGDANWAAARENVLEVMAERTGLTKALELLPPDGLPITVQVDLSAAVTVADWLASDTERFPYEGLEAPEDRRAEGLASITLPPPWRPRIDLDDVDPQALLHTRFPHLEDREIRPFQLAMVQAALSAPEPCLIIAEAPTGAGKTEGAFLTAEVLGARFGCGGTMIALPTMATSDGMFGRVLEWLGSLRAHDDVSVFLAHSKAGLNEDYSALTAKSFRRTTGVYDGDTAAPKGGPVVDRWLRGRKRGLLAGHVVSTIDQVLMGALQSKHLALRHLALTSKVVVIDEVHAADDYMRSYLCRALDWLGAYGVPVVLLSATLPSEQRQALVEAYVRGRRGRAGGRLPVEVPPAPSYPCLTVASTTVTAIAIDADTRSSVVQVEALPDEAVVTTVLEAVRDGGCVAVIRNTVGRAQATFAELRAALGEEVVLLHSRFIGPDRAALERDLRARLGPPHQAAERPRRLVVVGTQVLEQSLDVDFDLLISDIAPIDLVLQRLGRVHRHDRPAEDRPPNLRTPRLLITGITDIGDTSTGGPPSFDRGCVSVYGDYRLLRAVAVLLPHLAGQPIESPSDVPGLVERAYSPTGDMPPGWDARWQHAEAAHDRQVAEARRKAQDFQIKEPRWVRSLVGWLTTPVSAESDELERQGRAQVRDAEDSLEVVLVTTGDDGLARVMNGEHTHAGAVIPLLPGLADTRVTKAAAACTVRLPRSLTHPGVIDAVIEELEGIRGFEGWRDDPWLGGQLVLPLDHALTAHVTGHLVTYDRTLGLLVEVEESSKEEH